jgi:hypothetical protein
MVFRFCAALSLVVLIAATGIAVEKQLLDMKRQQTLQVYRLEQLEEMYARLKLRTQELGAPSRLMESLDQAEAQRAARRRPTAASASKRR